MSGIGGGLTTRYAKEKDSHFEETQAKTGMASFLIADHGQSGISAVRL
jgi:hypothetical protein